MRFHPKKYVKPTLPQQFLSKEVENLKPKTVVEKTNFSVWFLFRQWLFCRQWHFTSALYFPLNVCDWSILVVCDWSISIMY